MLEGSSSSPPALKEGVAPPPNTQRGSTTVAAALIDALCANGARRIFGLPGGGSSLDIIEAARRRRMPFVLARQETAAVMMAAATAELDGSIGVALVTKGPGTANAANGTAHAALDRAPVAVITDGFSPQIRAYVTHQWFDQRAMLAPVARGHGLLAQGDAAGDIDRLLALTRAPQRGPVHIELTGPAARRTIVRPRARRIEAPLAQASESALGEARRLLAKARRPVVVAGLEARERRSASAVRRFVRALGCPALVTYKAKGVIADHDPHYFGIFTGGASEQPSVQESDLIVLVGLDPVELILQPWPYRIPVLDVACARHPVHYVDPAQGVYGALAASVRALAQGVRRSAWTPQAIAEHRLALRVSLGYAGCGAGLTPNQVVETAVEAAQSLPRWPRATVDAGAHMFSATAFWPCYEPNGLLISNGLASMGFALPAAIASALHEPGRTTIAFTGDGGLLMCLGELATAVQTRARIVVVVFNDASLSLIDIKQRSRKLPAQGVRWTRPDFAAVMTGLGGRGYRAATIGEYRKALHAALRGKGPALIDVRVDPSGYPRQLAALRG